VNELGLKLSLDVKGLEGEPLVSESEVEMGWVAGSEEGDCVDFLG
jgi:hypothetical protein